MRQRDQPITTPEVDKSQLVLHICSLSTLSNGCFCPHTDPLSQSPHFVDWYRLLAVEEDADLDVIRRRYHRLALQLHPDKNSHPRADTAFKLVLQAYSVLSDTVKRRAFDVERWKRLCIDCNRVPYTLPNSSSSLRIRQALNDIRERFKEEARVMEYCLKVNAFSATELPVFSPSPSLSSNQLFRGDRCRRSRRESPVFNPSDYGVEGYPHLRSRRKQMFSQQHGQGSRPFESPIFENRIDRGMLNSVRS
ncbi:Chaperone protein DnaJ [Linum grandiflorum]